MPPSKILQGRCVEPGGSFHKRNKFFQSILFFVQIQKPTKCQSILVKGSLELDVEKSIQNYTFAFKNKLYKNSETEIGQKIRTNLEHVETAKCKDKKKKKMMNYISSKQVTKG